jgi:large subunit ribosomal protein LP1
MHFFLPMPQLHLQSPSPKKIPALTSATSVNINLIWTSLLAKALEGKNVKDLLLNVGAGGAVAPAVPAAIAGGAAKEAPEEKAKEEEKEESGDNMVSPSTNFFLVLLLTHVPACVCRASGCSTDLTCFLSFRPSCCNPLVHLHYAIALYHL